MAGRTDNNGRPLPASYPGAVVTHGLTPEEEHEWRKWTPKVGDVVLVDTFEDGLWPAKVCQKKSKERLVYLQSYRLSTRKLFSKAVPSPEAIISSQSAFIMKICLRMSTCTIFKHNLCAELLQIDHRQISSHPTPSPPEPSFNGIHCPTERLSSRRQPHYV